MSDLRRVFLVDGMIMGNDLLSVSCGIGSGDDYECWKESWRCECEKKNVSKGFMTFE